MYVQEDLEYVMKLFSVDANKAAEMLTRGLNIEYLRNGLKKETEAEMASIRDNVEQTAKQIIDEELKTQSSMSKSS